MNIKDFKGKRVTIFGLGLQNGGVGAARFFAQHGAKVIVTDIKTEKDLQPSIAKLKGLKIEFVLGKHLPENFIESDLIIKNPAIAHNSRYLQIAKEHSVPIETDITIFFKICQAPIIGITGTKGKSTTVALLGHLLKNKRHTVIAGNIGRSVFDVLPDITKESFVILELSSAQLEDLDVLKRSPHIAAITNIYPDHINRYGTFENYVEAKKNIYRYQKRNDYFVVSYDEKKLLELAHEAKSNVFVYSRKFNLSQSLSQLSKYNIGAYISDGNLLFGQNSQPICSLAELKIWGEHNIDNLLCAVTVASICGLDLKRLPKYLSDFKWLKYRLTLEKEKDGISFYNDSCATNPISTLRSLETVISRYGSKKIALIIGGEDKKLDFSILTSFIKANFNGGVFIIPGSGSDKIFYDLTIDKKNNFLLEKADNLEVAVDLALKYLKSIGGGAMLFSPACASFNNYKNEFDRGEHFSKIIAKI